MVNNRFGFNITASNAVPGKVESTTSLVDPVWINMITDTLFAGNTYFSEGTWTNHPARYYRINTP